MVHGIPCYVPYRLFSSPLRLAFYFIGNRLLSFNVHRQEMLKYRVIWKEQGLRVTLPWDVILQPACGGLWL